MNVVYCVSIEDEFGRTLFERSYEVPFANSGVAGSTILVALKDAADAGIDIPGNYSTRVTRLFQS